jgi:predicted acyltransferase
LKPGVPASNLRRNPGVDALRTLAILGMMSSHTSRLILYHVREAWSYWVLLLEPVIPSLFLFLVGISLTYSLSNALAKSTLPKAWYLRQARRALVLWLIMALFSGLEYGIRLPDVFLASGILCTIAYAILFIGGVLLLPGAAWILSGVLGLGVILFVDLDQTGSHTFPLISGDSPLLPLTLFALAGALWGLWMHRSQRTTNAVGVLALAVAGWMLHRYGLNALFTYPLGRSDATRLLAAPLTGGAAKVVGYYNLRPLLSLFCFCVHIGLLGIACLTLSRVKEVWAARLFTLGRHSLEIYVLHLTLLALLVVRFGLHPLTAAWQGNAVILTVIFLCLVWCFWRDRWKSLRTIRP